MDYINHHKWLVDSNLLTDEMKDNVAMVAYCLVEDVVDASTFMDFENHIVNYRVLLAEPLINNIRLLERYKSKTEDLGFFEMRRLKKFLKNKKENDESGLGYDLEGIANNFLKSYLSDKWNAKVEIKSAKDYDGKKDLWLYNEDNPSFN